jgi:hypothetical protein
MGLQSDRYRERRRQGLLWFAHTQPQGHQLIPTCDVEHRILAKLTGTYKVLESPGNTKGELSGRTVELCNLPSNIQDRFATG